MQENQTFLNRTLQYRGSQSLTLLLKGTRFKCHLQLIKYLANGFLKCHIGYNCMYVVLG